MNRTKSLFAAAALASTLLNVSPVQAAFVFSTTMSGPNSPSTATDEISFAGDVSGTDLLQGIAGTGGMWNGAGSDPDGLNDGDPGGDFDAEGISALLGAAWAADGDGVSFREFVLGEGSGLGFDITGIQSIAAWQGAGFSNQKYDVSVRFLGSATFKPLLNVDYQPFPALPINNGGSTKVNVTDDTGRLASGIDAIRFSVLDTNSDNGGGTVFREIDVFGAATIPEPSATTMLLVGATGLLLRRRSRCQAPL